MCGDPLTAARNAENIVARLVCRNVQRNLSGHMLYDLEMKAVWQVVEGSHDTIAELWELISKDTRHVIDDTAVLHEIADTRKYPLGWGMRYTKFEKVADKDTGHTLVPQDLKSSELVQLKYKSFLKDEGSSQTQIMEDVIPQAIVKNAKLDITGFLLYNDNTMTVYQVLEGPAGVVETLLDKIQKDPRHSVCAASVQRRAVQEREFPNWSMALEHVEQSTWLLSGY